jgi:hypothetical protein
VHFSADGRHIEASRFLLQGYRIKDALDETAMVRELRTICDEVSTEDFKVGLQQSAIFFCSSHFFIIMVNKPVCNHSIFKKFSTGRIVLLVIINFVKKTHSTSIRKKNSLYEKCRHKGQTLKK